MVWGFRGAVLVGSIDAIAESDRCWASSMTSRAIVLDASQCASFSRAEEDARPVAEAYLLLAGGEADAVVGVERDRSFRGADDRAQASNVSLMTLKCWAVHTMRDAGVRAARWIATQPMS